MPRLEKRSSWEFTTDQRLKGGEKFNYDGVKEPKEEVQRTWKGHLKEINVKNDFLKSTVEFLASKTNWIFGPKNLNFELLTSKNWIFAPKNWIFERKIEIF